MTRIIILFAAGLSLLAAGRLQAQDSNASTGAISTRVRSSQIKEPRVPAASVRIVLPSGVVVYAQLDPDGFAIDTATNPPTLRVKTVPPPAPAALEHIQIYRNSDGTFTLPAGRVVTVHRNGLLTLAPWDYTIDGTVLRFQDTCCEADEIVVVAVQK